MTQQNTPGTPLSEAQWEALRKVDSPTVANVIELFGIQSRAAGYMNHEIQAVYPKLPPAVGYAFTATFRAAHPAEAGGAYSAMPQVVADAQSVPAPRIMVFQDLDAPPRAATYGEVMTTALKAFGFVGLITSGGARDIEQVRAFDFPCWASSVIVAHGYCRIPETGVPVAVGGLKVRPGDLLHADANGVVCIPDRIAGAVAELCEPFIQYEETILECLRTPGVTAEAYRDVSSKGQEIMAQLQERARAMIPK